jgi:transposase
MAIVKVFVGLDYHDAFVQVCVMNRKGKILVNRKMDNDWQTIAAAVKKKGRVALGAIEACNGAAHLADELIHRAGWPLQLSHPGYVARLKQSPDKSDFSDAQLLADLARVGYIPTVWLAPPEVRELRRLVRFRQQLADERRNIKLRVGALLREHRPPRPPGRPWTQAWRAWLETLELPTQTTWIIQQQLRRLDLVCLDITQTEIQLAELVAEDRLVQFLLTLPGIGFVTAITLRAEIGRFDRFHSGKQLSRFCGLSPRNASSGHRQADAGLIRAGNSQLRAVILQAAHRLKRYEPRWKTLAARLRRRGKPGSVIAAAVANRWMRSLYHQVKQWSVAS